MKKLIFCCIINFLILNLNTSYAATAIGRVTTNPQQEHDYSLGKAWGWCNDEYEPEMNWAHRNLFDPTDDCVKKPKRKIILLKVITEKDT